MFKKLRRKQPELNPAEDTFEFTPPKPKSRLKNWFNRKKKWQKVLIVFGGIVLAIGLAMAIKTFISFRRTLTSGGGAPALSCKITPACLRKEGDGRINVMLLGVGGPNHPGGTLADTIMVVSIDPKTKQAAALSIPRDFYVPIGDVQRFGHSKVNASHAYGEQTKYPGGGPALTKQTLENVLDLPIHYFVRADFFGFKKAIDAVGGVDVNVEKPLYDPYYPTDSFNGTTMLRISAGRQHMNGDLALKFARSRQTTSDFDRAARQQLVLLALKEKVFSLGTLSNPVKVQALIDTVGSHVRTDVSFGDLKDLIKIIKDVDTSSLKPKVLDTSADNVLMFGNIPGAGSIIIPKAGLDKFIDVRIMVHSLFTDSYIQEENAPVEVQNGTFTAGFGTEVSRLLKGYGYNVVKTTTAARQNHIASTILDHSGGKKPFTLNYLERRFGVKAQKAARPAGSTADFTVIVGSTYQL